MEQKIMSKPKKNSKAQSEIVGFMIIILIVVIVGVVFLGIYLRKAKPIVKEDAEIANFLISSMRYTSDCYKDYEPNYRKLGELASDCYGSAKISCPGSKSACSALDETYSWMLSKLWNPGVNRPVKYAGLYFYYEQTLEQEDEEPAKNKFYSIIQGNKTGCSVLKASSSAISMDSGNIVVELEICKAG
jgi:hypothetical protein